VAAGCADWREAGKYFCEIGAIRGSSDCRLHIAVCIRADLWPEAFRLS
jgi:hypothetical protein